MYNIQCESSIYINTLFFDSSIAWKCIRADNEKQEINLVWPKVVAGNLQDMYTHM